MGWSDKRMGTTENDEGDLPHDPIDAFPGAAAGAIGFGDVRVGIGDAHFGLDVEEMRRRVHVTSARCTTGPVTDEQRSERRSEQVANNQNSCRGGLAHTAARSRSRADGSVVEGACLPVSVEHVHDPRWDVVPSFLR